MQTLHQSRIEAFAGLIAVEAGAAVNAALVNIGDRLGLYRAMADSQPVTAAELAARTSTHERYVREWLNAQAAGGFVTYDAADDTYVLPAEHAFVLADETSPVAMAGIYSAVTAAPASTAMSPANASILLWSRVCMEPPRGWWRSQGTSRPGVLREGCLRRV